MVTTDGHLLGGRVRYRQPAAGFRSGLEPVLLAASVPARAGDHVLEAGTGAGAAALCLAFRVPGVAVTAVEIDPSLAALAAVNARENGFECLEVRTGDIGLVTLGERFDHAMANPPYHKMEGPSSPDRARDVAKRGSATLLAHWIARLAGGVRRRGSLTLIVPAGVIPQCLTAMAAARCPCTVIFPLWPKEGRSAKLVLLRGLKESRTPLALMTGLVLHQVDGAFTEATQAVLADAAALSLRTP